MPITFWASLPPCPTLNMADDTNCNLLNQALARLALRLLRYKENTAMINMIRLSNIHLKFCEWKMTLNK